MVGEKNIGNHYLNAAINSDRIEEEIKRFENAMGNKYPINMAESDEIPKGSASWYLIKPKQVRTLGTQRLEELAAERDIIGHLD